jgi:hypothetical protein
MSQAATLTRPRDRRSEGIVVWLEDVGVLCLLWADFPIGTTAADPSVAGEHAEQLVAAMLDNVKV